MSDPNDDDFCEMVRYFWQERRDPACFSGWDEERCRKLMPVFYDAWSRYQLAEKTATLAADQRA